MFASPALVRQVARRSPRIRALPVAIQRRIYASAGDVTGAGDYAVTGAPSGLNMRSAASSGAQSVGMLQNGDVVQSDGTVDNGYAYCRFVGTSGMQDGWVSVMYLAPTSAPAGSPAPAGPDLSAGTYKVKTVDGKGVNFREAPSTDAVIMGGLPDGSTFEATGENMNFFSHGAADGKMGWVASIYLVPATAAQGSGALELSAADTLQLRTILAAWSHATSGAPAYGLATDMATTPAADVRQAQVVAAFQQWHGGLRTDGVVDVPTQNAVLGWAQNAVVGAAGGGPNPLGLPQLPAGGGVTPGPAPSPGPKQTPDGTPIQPVSTSSGPSGGPSDATPLLLVGGAVVAGLLLLEQKKKKKGKR